MPHRLSALIPLLLALLLAVSPAAAGETARRLVRAGFDRTVARAIERHLEKPGVAVAIFDHDHTLLHGDVCNGKEGAQPGFFRELVDRGKLKPEGIAVTPPDYLPDPLAYFEVLRRQGQMNRAYGWRNGLLAGFTPAELYTEAHAYYDRHCAPWLYPAMKALVAELKRRSAEVYVLSAAPADVIRPAASHLGLPPGNVFGIWFRLRDGKMTTALDGPNIYGIGKRWVIENRIRPADASRLMVFGDSWENDGYMLRLAKRRGGLAVMINPDAEERRMCRLYGMPWADVKPPHPPRRTH